MRMISIVWVKPVEWVGEIQLCGRTGGVQGKNSAVRGRSVEWVGEIQVGERTGRLMGMISVVRVRVTMLDSRPSLRLLLVWWR